MKLITLLYILFLTTACATKIVYDSPLKITNIPKLTNKKSISLLYYDEFTSNVYWSGTRHFLKHSDEEAVKSILSYLADSKYFTYVEAREGLDEIEKLNLDISEDNGGNAYFEATEKYLKENSFPTKTDIQLNLRQIGQMGHPYILLPYAVWTLVHIGSLGLIPVVFWSEHQFSGEITSRERKVIYKFNKTCKASVWNWSPLIFAKSTEPQGHATKHIAQNCMNAILAEAVTTGNLDK